MTNLVLPDFDDEDLDQEMKRISQQDYEVLKQIVQLTQSLDWYEKMALGLSANHSIQGEGQLCNLTPHHGEYSPKLKSAIALLRHLSPQAKVDLAIDILSDDWDLGSVDADYAPSTLIE